MTWVHDRLYLGDINDANNLQTLRDSVSYLMRLMLPGHHARTAGSSGIQASVLLGVHLQDYQRS